MPALLLVAGIGVLMLFCPPAFAEQPKIYAIQPDGSAKVENERPNLAKCLAGKGFVFYGASWCPYCAQQIRMFGADAKDLPYVECSVDGKRRGKDAPLCEKKGIRSYPTWIYPDGRRGSGVKSIEKLAKLSGCPA